MILSLDPRVRACTAGAVTWYNTEEETNLAWRMRGAQASQGDCLRSTTTRRHRGQAEEQPPAPAGGWRGHRQVILGYQSSALTAMRGPSSPAPRNSLPSSLTRTTPDLLRSYSDLKLSRFGVVDGFCATSPPPFIAVSDQNWRRREPKKRMGQIKSKRPMPLAWLNEQISLSIFPLLENVQDPRP